MEGTWSAAVLVAVAAGCGRVGFDDRVDAQVDPGPAACTIPGVTLFCDDFEHAELTRWDSANADVQRVDAPVRAGAGALRASVAIAPDTSWLAIRRQDFATAPALYLRFWILVTASSSRWTCIELDVTVDDVAGALELRIDGTPVITDGAIDTRATGEIDLLNLGFPWTNGGQGAATAYYDDVHLATASVGCGS